MELEQNDIHLWLAFTDEIHDADVLEAYRGLMSESERKRYKRYHFEKDRKTHLIARALVRTTLSRYADVDPAAWRFVTNDFGRPEIDRPGGVPPLRFNLSHTKGVVALGVTLAHAIGVDVETHGRVREVMALSKRFFSPDEYDALARSTPSKRNEDFYRYWTLKESFIKACGQGLSFPLDKFSFHFKKNARLGISFETGIDQDPDLWQFWLMAPTHGHSLAIALANDPRQAVRLTTMAVVPLENEHRFTCPMIARS